MATLMSYFAPPIAGEWGDEAEDNTDGVCLTKLGMKYGNQVFQEFLL